MRKKRGEDSALEELQTARKEVRGEPQEDEGGGASYSAR